MEDVVRQEAGVGLSDERVFALIVLRAGGGGAEGLGEGGHEGGAGGGVDVAGGAQGGGYRGEGFGGGEEGHGVLFLEMSAGRLLAGFEGERERGSLEGED